MIPEPSKTVCIVCHHAPCCEIRWRCQESGSRTQKVRRLCIRGGWGEGGGKEVKQSHVHRPTLTKRPHIHTPDCAHKHLPRVVLHIDRDIPFCHQDICIHVAHVRSYHMYAHALLCAHTSHRGTHSFIQRCSYTGRQPNNLAWKKFRRGSQRQAYSTDASATYWPCLAVAPLFSSCSFFPSGVPSSPKGCTLSHPWKLRTGIGS